MEVIILAGGFGTRLNSVVKDVPKPMADINNKPFLQYLLDYLLKYNITDVVLSVGYKQDVIKNHFKDKYKSINIKYSAEETPLDTGGAIKKAISILDSEDEKVFVINGDTFFDIDLHKLEINEKSTDSDITLSLKEMTEFDRYGSVEVESGIVKGFKEKMYHKKALINGGVYMIKKDIFKSIKEDKFSFEEFLQRNIDRLKITSLVSNRSYFIDIGIPSDYKKAKSDFLRLMQ